MGAIVVEINERKKAEEERDEAVAALQEIVGIEVLPLTIGRRKAFPNAAARGRAVTEAIPRDVKAVAELQALVTAVYT